VRTTLSCEHDFDQYVQEEEVAEQHCIPFHGLHQYLSSTFRQTIEDGEYLVRVQPRLTFENVKIQKFDHEGKEQRRLSTPVINQSIQLNNPIASSRRVCCHVYRSCSSLSTLRNVELNDVG
jgi:hypothetical protein